MNIEKNKQLENKCIELELKLRIMKEKLKEISKALNMVIKEKGK